MGRKRNYTKADFIKIVYESEGRLSPVSNEPGHTLKQHLLIADHHITDRIIPNLGSTTPTTPIIVDEHGKVASELLHREIWKELDSTLTTSQAKNNFRKLYLDAPKCAGAFLDIQQIGTIGKYVLNSTEGQEALGKLDGTETRVSVKKSLNWLDNTTGTGWKMRFSSLDNDITHLTDFNNVFMLVDKLPNDEIHLQTFYPIK